MSQVQHRSTRSQKKIVTSKQQFVTDELLDMNLNVDMPHNVMVNSIPGMGDIMNTWRVGVKAIQDMFNEHVETMTYEFERKTQQFD